MIICCGEALIDMLPDGDGHRPVLGGSIFNTARVSARLGLPTAYVSAVSTDEYGDQFIDALEKSSVSTQFVKRVDRPTALAYVSLNNGQAEYEFVDKGSASREVTADELPATVPGCELAHFGSISLVTEPCATAYNDFAHKLSKQTTIALDPNIRPAFIIDRDPHRARLEELIAISDIVKLSEEDLEWFGKLDAQRTAERWLSGRTSIVVVTRGEAGVTGYCKDGHINVPAAKVTVVDTVGAGDSFSAGLYAGLKENPGLDRHDLAKISIDQLTAALARGIEVSSQVVQQEGAELPWT